MKNQSQTERLCILTAKTGIFFAKCDGDYDTREQDFIHSYIKLLELNGILTSGTKENLETLESAELTIQQIIEETNLFLSQLKDAEKQECIKALERFIRKVINADNVIKPEETENFRIWKEHINLQ